MQFIHNKMTWNFFPSILRKTEEAKMIWYDLNKLYWKLIHVIFTKQPNSTKIWYILNCSWAVVSIN